MNCVLKVYAALFLALSVLLTQTPCFAKSPVKTYPIGCIVNPADPLMTSDICKRIKESGVNFIMPPSDFTSNAKLNDQMLESAKTANLKVFIQDPGIMTSLSASPNGDKTLNTLLSEYSHYSNLMGYCLSNVPTPAQYRSLAGAVRYLTIKDPKRLVFINLASDDYSPESIGTDTFDEYLSQYWRAVHPPVLCNSHFYFLKEDEKTGFYGNLISMQHAWKDSYIPFWQIIQLSPDATHPELTDPQILWEVMQSLTYGAQGIIYNGCWPFKGQEGDWGPGLFDDKGKMTIQYAMVQKVNAEVQMMGKYLVDSAPVSSFQNGAPESDAQGPQPDLPVSFADQAAVNAGLFRADTHLYVIISNRSWTQPVKTTALFYIYNNKPQYLDKKTDKWVFIPVHTDENGNQHVEVNLAPGDAEMFRW